MMEGVLFSFLILLAAQNPRSVVMDRSHVIPSGQWSYVEVPVRIAPAVVHAEYSVLRDAREMRLAMIAHHDLNRFHDEGRRVTLAATPFDSSGRLRYVVRQPATLALVVDNTRAPRDSTEVRLRVELESAVAPVELSAARRVVVIALGLAVFAVAVAGSARGLRANAQ